MKHELVSVKLVSKAKHWKDKAAEYHQWKVVTRCEDGTLCTETLRGRKDDVIQTCLNDPECSCMF